MFAIPFAASSPDSLTGHVFGRFLSLGSPAEAGESPVAAAAPMTAAAAPEDDIPDLAQRVREVGEW